MTPEFEKKYLSVGKWIEHSFLHLYTRLLTTFKPWVYFEVSVNQFNFKSDLCLRYYMEDLITGNIWSCSSDLCVCRLRYVFYQSDDVFQIKWSVFSSFLLPVSCFTILKLRWWAKKHYIIYYIIYHRVCGIIAATLYPFRVYV